MTNQDDALFYAALAWLAVRALVVIGALSLLYLTLTGRFS